MFFNVSCVKLFQQVFVNYLSFFFFFLSFGRAKCIRAHFDYGYRVRIYTGSNSNKSKPDRFRVLHRRKEVTFRLGTEYGR